jgi:hypothetical protein
MKTSLLAHPHLLHLRKKKKKDDDEPRSSSLSFALNETLPNKRKLKNNAKPTYKMSFSFIW